MLRWKLSATRSNDRFVMENNGVLHDISREEAAALRDELDKVLKPKSILDLTVSTTLEEAVFMALGAASVCWDNPGGGSGVFHSERAKQIGEELIEYFKSKQPIY